MKSTKLIALVLVVVTCFGILASCNLFKKPDPTPTPTPDENTIKEGNFTYNSYASALGTNWNPHTWETSADSSIAGYLEMPLVTMQALDTENGVYQWIYEMATAITDVTATHQSDLTKYKVTLPENEDGTIKAATEVTEGYVFEIKLNPNAKWQNGDVINADSYIYSMEKLLNSKMRNYRANLYYDAESALAGGLAYYNSEAPIYEVGPWLVWSEADEWYAADSYIAEYSFDDEGYAYVTVDGVKTPLYISTSLANACFGTDWKTIHTDYGYGPAGYFYKPYEGDVTADLPGYVVAVEQKVDKDGDGEPDVDSDGKPVTETVYYENLYNKLSVKEDSFGVFKPTAADMADIEVLCQNFARFGANWNEFVFAFTGYGDKVEWDTVGLYKVDDYTINYVCQTQIDYNYFLTSCTSNWLVHPSTYEATMEEEAGLTITKYGTSKETSMSYGPYMMETFEDDKQVVFVQNPNWYGWEKTESGYLYSMTPYEVDGESRQRYQTTKIVIDVMTQEVANQKFLKGELMDYAPTPEELTEYTLSDRLTRVDETYTMSFFFNTDESVLKNLDTSTNENSIVLSNYNFRKAFSLAFNRADFVTVTEGYSPAYSLMNKLYHYDIYNDPTSSYRASEPAMQAICNLYGVKYGEGEIYATLEEAYNSITGYNLTEAKALMKTACEELVAAGLYTAGENIKIQIGWKKGAMEDADNAQVAKVQEYLNAAVAGSGFGSVTIEGIGNLEDRYGDVPAGKFAIGYGAWGGAAFYPFRNFQVYCDTVQYAGQINELGCWNPATTNLTLTVDGEEVTMTWQDWSRSMTGTGKFANVSNDIKLEITAAMEQKFLEFYYRIPLCGTTICSLLSYKADYYTWDYNIMYGFGGLELMTYNYDDAEWAVYVAEQGGTLNYK